MVAHLSSVQYIDILLARLSLSGRHCVGVGLTILLSLSSTSEVQGLRCAPEFGGLAPEDVRQEFGCAMPEAKWISCSAGISVSYDYLSLTINI